MPTEIATEEKPFSLAEEIAKEAAAANETEPEVKETDDGQVQSEGDEREVAEETAEEPEETQETPADADEHRRLLAWVKQNFDEDLTVKYKSDAEAIRGLLNASKLVGRRDEDAEFGRRIREKYGDVESLINAGLTQKKPEPVAEEEPIDWKTYQLLRAQVIDDNGVLKKDADPAKVARVNKIAEEFNQRMFNMAFATEQTLTPVLEKIKPSISKELEKQQQAEAEKVRFQQTVTGFKSSNAEWLYNDKKSDASGLTLRGTQFVECLKQVDQYAIPIEAKLDLAMAKFKAEHGAPIQAPPAKKPAAKRTPNVATKVATEDDDDKVLATSGFAALVKRKWERGEK